MQPIKFDQLEKQVSLLTGASPIRYEGIENDVTFEVPAEGLPSIVQMLASDFNCHHLSAITAQQHSGQEEHMKVLYHFWQGTSLSFLVRLSADAPELPSIISILPGADFYEREAAEMFGIVFTGRADTPHLLLPDDWKENPSLRLKEEKDD